MYRAERSFSRWSPISVARSSIHKLPARSSATSFESAKQLTLSTFEQSCCSLSTSHDLVPAIG
jgi:hypothetical protein